jgi:hypothetical protein
MVIATRRRLPMKVLIVLNDPPYGTERSYNGIRLAKLSTWTGPWSSESAW